jgi:3-oxoacyl-[acyl-carrier-protein] synthase II
MIERGLVDVVIAGSLETSIVPIIEAAFSQMGVLSSSTRMAPFTMGRDGFVLGEGGGLFILRRMAEVESAKGVINGYAYGNDSYHPVEFDPSGRSIIRIMTEAMRDAGQGTVDYINAHGTGTRLNDEVEARAFQKVFSSGQKPYISSTKAHTGHLLGATGSVELGLCLLSLEYEAFIPQKNLIDPMPEMALFLTPRILCPPATCLTLNYGFGGHLAALMIARP